MKCIFRLLDSIFYVVGNSLRDDLNRFIWSLKKPTHMISSLQFANFVLKALIQRRIAKAFILLITLIFVSPWAFSQSLTISSSGQTGTSGTNWSTSGNTLTVTGTANIAASVIENQLAFSSLSIEGNTTSFTMQRIIAHQIKE